MMHGYDNNKTTRVFENVRGDLIITDVSGVKLIPWGGNVQEIEYGLRAWATDQVSATQRAHAEGYWLDSVDVDGVEIYRARK